jgi:hypothetical protein
MHQHSFNATRFVVEIVPLAFRPSVWAEAGVGQKSPARVQAEVPRKFCGHLMGMYPCPAQIL